MKQSLAVPHSESKIFRGTRKTCLCLMKEIGTCGYTFEKDVHQNSPIIPPVSP
jgi:hypothetical protein